MQLNDTALQAAMEAGLFVRFEQIVSLNKVQMDRLKENNRDEYEAAIIAYLEAAELTRMELRCE